MRTSFYLLGYENIKDVLDVHQNKLGIWYTRPLALRDNVVHWLDEHVGDWEFRGNCVPEARIVFDKDEDCVAFRLRWL